MAAARGIRVSLRQRLAHHSLPRFTPVSGAPGLQSEQLCRVASADTAAVRIRERSDRVEAGDWIVHAHIERKVSSENDLTWTRLTDEKLQIRRCVDERVEPDAFEIFA